MRRNFRLVSFVLMVAACGGKKDPGSGSDESGTSGSEDDSGGVDTLTTMNSATLTDPSGETLGGSQSGGGDSEASGIPTTETMSGDTDSTMGGSEAGTTDPTATTGGSGVACSGQVWSCGDGTDNDSDGKIDLEDPECTGPCDDKEDSFQTGLPGDNMDCKQDCFFDGNSGQGDDGCIWSLRCDPENPGANVGCEYTGGQNCNNETQTDNCIMYCTQFVPNGCDCFGCCTVDTGNGEVNVFLGSGPDCSLTSLDACESCTPSTDCGNPCDPMDCELCFGESELPEGCDEPGGCEGGLPCTVEEDCPVDFYCLTGCCLPPPPG